ncbi:SDR family oxidoreductase [Vibrio natriegens]|uniref:Short chain dehydrogenase n=1 Tax=Vibrio natriegens NBRC 15636 = ATCC 14048 = DSM 759 TaxID=1219067 RepID=A0AAN1CWL4_VIBNA|nr:SDR family oxidoreductase [Vibrio natriegens]ALR15400.1 short-chain dehydrogenase [Vibrio natriegens NBRC 15636 = ATCC 14048 = DSM 759]ANQ12740.1 short chain dehydrogenase [Vibrio natriegens NBRC 15636 = ATCC 14048 = DSM 759]EPM38347.1 short-chain dehydrogenase [Vibrio natriegens NBRC 15636 = ATCC 14048 = DSM 759]MDX6027140.1 SDR family oxidoreductase [Vibrio natriegens NBRC 15636 = ATCC 14048 = DSM 759]UUI10465.1 SDR family oxidoreductase [Vibrio natriegens]
MNIKDSKILLTGATGGIGQSIATELANRGATLILVGRNEEKLFTLMASLANPDSHDVLVADITTTDGLNAVRDLARQKQKVDALINNAGSNDFSLLSQKRPTQIEADIQLNLVAPMLLCQSALSWLKQPGVILNIGSTFGSIGYPGYTSYCAAKAGLHRFTEALDRELFATGIRALYLAPRATETSLNSDTVNELNQKLGNKTDSPQVVAEHVVTMLEKEISAKWIGWPEKLFARINQLLPNIVSSAIRKQQDTIHEYVNRASH